MTQVDWSWLEGDQGDPEALQLLENWSSTWRDELPELLDNHWSGWTEDDIKNDVERLKNLIRGADMPFFEEETLPFFDEDDEIDPNSMTLTLVD